MRRRQRFLRLLQPGAGDGDGPDAFADVADDAQIAVQCFGIGLRSPALRQPGGGLPLAELPDRQVEAALILPDATTTERTAVLPAQADRRIAGNPATCAAAQRARLLVSRIDDRDGRIAGQGCCRGSGE